jgi:hypothetical protein
MPYDQQSIPQYFQYGVFWLYNWFQADNNNMYIYFLMNGNIYGSSLASPEQYSFSGGSAHPILPNPPSSIFAQSYINAYNTAFNQPVNSQIALYGYYKFYPTSQYINNNFVPGTFGYDEQYNGQGSNLGSSITIGPLQDDESAYSGIPCLFISAGSGGGSGYMYLDWVIVTYGVTYVVGVS